MPSRTKSSTIWAILPTKARGRARGMVMGHVQSGKDPQKLFRPDLPKLPMAGYKIIILLARHHEFSGSQTQEVSTKRYRKESVFHATAEVAMPISRMRLAKRFPGIRARPRIRILPKGRRKLFFR